MVEELVVEELVVEEPGWYQGVEKYGRTHYSLKVDVKWF